MTAQEYIESGILEAYATGQLSLDEMADVERMAGATPEIQSELDAIMAALDQYAGAHHMQPASETRNRVMNSIKDVVPEPPKEVRELRPNSFWPKLAVAASVLLIISLIGNLILYFNLSDSLDRIATLENEQTVLAQQYTSIQTQYTQQNNLLKTAIDPNSRKVQLKGVKAFPDAQALVVWNPNTETTYLIPSGLPDLPSGKQYQLWSLVDGQPKDAGLLAVNRYEPQRLSDVSEAEMFAITIEPEGGSDSPTLDQMIVAGAL